MTARPRIAVDVPPHQVPVLAVKAPTCARALDMSLTTFLSLVGEGKMPKPVQVPDHPGLALYDWEAVRNAWRAIVEGDGTGGNPWD